VGVSFPVLQAIEIIHRNERGRQGRQRIQMVKDMKEVSHFSRIRLKDVQAHQYDHTDTHMKEGSQTRSYLAKAVVDRHMGIKSSKLSGTGVVSQA
jgi:hypothetical protein